MADHQPEARNHRLQKRFLGLRAQHQQCDLDARREGAVSRYCIGTHQPKTAQFKDCRFCHLRRERTSSGKLLVYRLFIARYFQQLQQDVRPSGSRPPLYGHSAAQGLRFTYADQREGRLHPRPGENRHRSREPSANRCFEEAHRGRRV